MCPELLRAATDFSKRARVAGFPGRLASTEEITTLQDKLGRIVPTWYLDLIRSVPVIGAEFEWLEKDTKDEDDCTSSCMWYAPGHTIGETLEAYPGVEVMKDGYFCIFADSSGGGDPYFVRETDDSNPEVLQICHERYRDIEREIRGFSAISAASSFSSFLENVTF